MNPLGITKSGGQKHSLDKFYTKPSVAAWCLKKLNLDDYDLIIEPSAGSGSFSKQLPEGSLALDLDPEDASIIQQDFFTFAVADKTQRTLIVGNPPFGQQNSLAVRFINHAATFAETIAFILPRSFDKESVQRRINLYFHLVFSEVLPKNSFTLDTQEYDVPCVFQVWQRRENVRTQVTRLTTSEHFSFVKDPGEADFSIRRVGGNAGKASLNTAMSPQSNYFVVNRSSLSAEDFVFYVNSLSFPSRDSAVGPRTLSKGELVESIDKNFPLEDSVDR